MRNKIDKNHIKQYYNKEEYIKDAAGFATNDYNNRIRLVTRFIELKKISNIVELGCGAGILRDIHRNYIGLDISENAIKKLKNAKCCDIGENIPLEAKSADAIISFNTLEHITSPDRTLEECARIIRPGGRIIFQEAFNVRRGSRMYHTIRVLCLRLLSFFSNIILNKKKLSYFRIRPDYTKIGGDYDACSQVDPYAIYLWSMRRGFRCLNKKNMLSGIFWKDNFIALEKMRS